MWDLVSQTPNILVLGDSCVLCISNGQVYGGDLRPRSGVQIALLFLLTDLTQPDTIPFKEITNVPHLYASTD